MLALILILVHVLPPTPPTTPLTPTTTHHVHSPLPSLSLPLPPAEPPHILAMQVQDFFGVWDSALPGFVQKTHQVGPYDLACLLAEVVSLLIRWYDQFLAIRISDRELVDLRILDREFHDAAKAVLGFKATWKKHQMEEAGESRMDLGDQVSGNLTEAAHRLSKFLFEHVTNRQISNFTPQLASARNTIVAAQLYKREYEASIRCTMGTSTQFESEAPVSQELPTSRLQFRRRRSLELAYHQRAHVHICPYTLYVQNCKPALPGTPQVAA